jgi:hypothetical protein
MNEKVFSSGYLGRMQCTIGENMAVERTQNLNREVAAILPDVFTECLLNDMTAASLNRYKANQMYSYMTNWIREQVFVHSSINRDITERKGIDLAKAR